MSKGRARFWVRLALTMLFIALLARKVDFRQLGIALRQLDFRWAAVGFAVTPTMILLLTARLILFLRQQDIRVRFRDLLLLTWAGQFFNSVLPGSTGGDVVKIYQLCRQNPHCKAGAAVAVIVDRMSALLALLCLASLAVAFGPTARVSLAPVPQKLIWVAALAAIAVAFVAAGLATRYMSARWLTRIATVWAAFRESLTLSTPVVAGTLLAFALHLTNFSLFYLFAHALRIAISYSQVLLIAPVVLLIVMLPITVNGHGLRELVLVYYFKQMHISVPAGDHAVTETIISLSLVMIANDLLWSAPGGLWYLAARAGPEGGNTRQVMPPPAQSAGVPEKVERVGHTRSWS